MLNHASYRHARKAIKQFATSFVQTNYSNAFRGFYTEAENCTKMILQTKQKIAHLINAQVEEILFLPGSGEFITLCISPELNPGLMIKKISGQELMHHKIDVKAQMIDIAYFSSSDIWANAGVGICYINPNSVPKISCFFAGGGGINTVSEREVRLKNKFASLESGTPALSQIASLKKACDFLA